MAAQSTAVSGAIGKRVLKRGSVAEAVMILESWFQWPSPGAPGQSVNDRYRVLKPSHNLWMRPGKLVLPQ